MCFFVVFGNPPQGKTSEELVICVSVILCFGISIFSSHSSNIFLQIGHLVAFLNYIYVSSLITIGLLTFICSMISDLILPNCSINLSIQSSPLYR